MANHCNLLMLVLLLLINHRSSAPTSLFFAANSHRIPAANFHTSLRLSGGSSLESEFSEAAAKVGLQPSCLLLLAPPSS
jgi:hypothetical protein